MDTEHFESREVGPHAQYAAASALVEGETYFAVHFVDDEMHIPEVRPLVFIGRDREVGDLGQLYFQDAASYLKGVRYDSPDSSDAEFHTVHQDTPFVLLFANERLHAAALR